MRFLGVALAILLLGLALQWRCLSFEKVIDDVQLIDSVEQRGCGANPIDCFRHPVFLLYYRPLFTATFALGDRLHSRDAVFISLIRSRSRIRSRKTSSSCVFLVLSSLYC